MTAQSYQPLTTSVIIPVLNDIESLESCLEALAHQTYDSTQYEIIVVDNGSEEIASIQSLIKKYSQAKLVQELTPGSYAARNKGISIAQGEIIAFTDADCIPAPNWLEKGVQFLLENPKCGLVGGQIKMQLANPEDPNMVELCESVRALPQQEFIEKDHFAATANLFTNRATITQIGTFNSELKSSGDVEWGRRVHAHGLQLKYNSEALIFHPTHSSFNDFFIRTRRLAGGHYDLRMRQAKSNWQRRINVIKLLIYNLIPPVFFAIHTLLNPEITGIDKKLKISWMMWIVRYISFVEILRLQFGKTSIRI